MFGLKLEQKPSLGSKYLSECIGSFCNVEYAVE